MTTGARTAGIPLLRWFERRFGVRGSGAVAIAASIASYILARVVGSRTLLLLVYGMVVVVVGSGVAGRRQPRLTAERSEIPRRVREGQAVEVQLTLTAGRRLSTMILEEGLHVQLGGDIAVPLPVVPSGAHVEHTYTFVPRLRGVYPIGPLTAVWSDPFGLTAHRATLIEPAELIVHPAIENLHDRISTREWEDPPVRPPFSKPWPSGFEFYGMREYVSGDDPRRIVWRAVARMSQEDGDLRLLVREAEQGITDRVAIVLDTGRAHHSAGVPSETFETCVRLAASLGVRHLDDGFSVSLDTNERRVVDSMRGRSSRVRFLDAMARLQLESDELTTLIDRLVVEPRRDVHTVLIAPHLDHVTAARLKLLVQRGVSLVIALVLDEDADPSSVHRAAALGCAVVEIPAGAPVAQRFERIVSGVHR